MQGWGLNFLFGGGEGGNGSESQKRGGVGGGVISLDDRMRNKNPVVQVLSHLLRGGGASRLTTSRP